MSLPAPDASLTPEQRVARLWQQLLGRERISPEEDFFSAGGHSLMAAQLKVQLDEEFHVLVPLADVLQASTIRAQAKLVSALVGTRGEPIPSLPPGAPRYASPAQERLWFLEELVPGNPALRIPELTRLTGPLDVAALRAAFDDLVARHDVLHCAVRSAPAGLVLEPRTPAPFTLPVEDLRGLAVEERLARAAELARAELGRPFDLGQPPFLRARLFHTDAQEHLLLLDVHHLIADRASLGVLAQELAVLYARRTGSSEAELPALRLSFADVATWQHHALGGPLLAAQADYWREALNGCEPVLELPTDAPRPALQTFRGARLHVAYPSALLEPVLSLGREVGASPFVTMLSAFGVLLHRRSGQSDFVVGAPFAGRERAELQGLVGCFVNTLPLRVRLEGDPGFRELLGRMRETALGAFSHAALPFEHIARQLRLKQDPSRPPLTQVLFTLENGQLPLPRAGSLTLAPLELDPGVAQAELLLHLETRTEGMVGWFEYNCALFTEATVAAMDAELRVLLAELAGRPGERVSRLRVLTPGDEAARWAAGAARATVPLREPSLQRAFQRQAERAPEAVALIDGERRYTYGELAAVANGLARRLWAAGVRPGARVLLWAERSAESVASILAILQCGAAYVPVDPAYPAERIRYLTGDCGASVALAPAGRGGLLPSGALRVLEVSAADFVATESEAVEGGASPSDAAYVIYTSGTTGKPKGVVVTHGNVLRLLTASEATFDFGPSDVWTLFHSLAFDFSVWELWGALAYGGSLLVVGDEAKDARAFAEALVHHRVTVLSQTPSAFRPLMLEPGLERGALRYVVFGGEALEFASLRPWFERMAGKGPRLVNMYGITETTVHVTAREVRPEEAAGARPSLIGAPLADLELHVLDGQLRPVPVGVVGELHVGGAGLALGYLHRPGLTAERFVPHPVREGARLYKSGDLARVLPGGDVEYCGRSDQQVKVRGFRIELGEIEAALLGHPGVLDARVLPLRQEGETRLVAYLRPRAEPAPEPRALRAFLRETLPEYMVPWRFVPVQDLELTAHGKLDTRALPVPSFNEPESAADASSLPALAGTATQQRVGGIFRELLGLAHVGLDDDFFDLGGHSLMAARLVTRLREHHGVSLPLRAFFDKPTVREVSRKLDEARAPQAPAEVTVRAQRGGPLPLSAAQRDIFLFEQLQSGSAAFHVPMCARLRGPLDLGVLERALARVLARHEVLRSRFDVYGGTPGQLPTDDCASRLEVRDLRGLSPDARERAWRDELPRAAAAPFDLRREAPLRTQVWRLSEDEHVVLFVLHHLACDGWSVGLFLDELRGAFERVQAGTAEPAPLRLQVADHAAAQTQQDASAEALAFWRQGLAGVSALAPLPTDHARGEKRSLRGAVQPVEVVGPAWTALRRLGAEERATPYMVAAALYVLALRGRGLDEVLLGSPVGARGAVALEPLIGCFLNTVLLRVKPALELSFRELLRAVREHTLAVLANADVPFAQVRQTCLPARREGNPFHAWLVLQNAPRVFPALPGVAVEPVEVPPPELKFELALELTETARGLEGQLAYQATLFEPETMSAFAATLQALATAAGDAPDAPVGALMEEQQRAERARRESQARSSLQSLRGRRGGAVKSQEHHDED